VLERFIKLHPTSPAVDYALYLQGLVNFNDNLGILGSSARRTCPSATSRPRATPTSRSSSWSTSIRSRATREDAQVRMNYITNSLAAYEVHVARYYYRRGAYVAAANRAQQAVQEFQQSPSTEEALFIMSQSYDKLGLTQLRDDAAARAAAELSRQTLRQTSLPSGAVVVEALVGWQSAGGSPRRSATPTPRARQPGQRLFAARQRRHRRQRLAQPAPVVHAAMRGSQTTSRPGRSRCGSAARRPASATPRPRRRSSRRTRCAPRARGA
jgi:hypothetical protein